MSVRVADYVLMEEFKIYGGPMDDKVLPAGSFVKPIVLYYVPKHVTEAYHNRWFNQDREQYCYTHFGIVAIPKDKIRKI